MELDQLLFKKVFGYITNWKKKRSSKELDRSIALADISSRITLIARALTGRNIDIMPAESEGGVKNVIFYLPSSFSYLKTIEENVNFLIFRTVYSSIQFELELNWQDNTKIHNLEDSRSKANEASALILERMAEDYPPVYRFFQKIESRFGEEDEQLPSYWISGKFMTDRDVTEGEVDENFNKDSHKKNGLEATTEIKSKAVEEVEVIKVDKKAQEDYVLMHNFEKVETAEEFSGVWRGFDGDDNLQEDADALKELNLRHLVRTDEVAHSIYQADFRDLSTIAASADTNDEGSFLRYKEWDRSKKRYLPEHCKVYLRKIISGDQNYAKTCLTENTKTLNSLRKKFAQINQTRRTVKRLPDGDSIDTDCLVDWFTDLRSGRTPSDNIYLSSRKKEPDLAILFLLDLSLSTDSYADGNRVLDVEKQAVILFGEVLTEYNVDFAVSGFFSKTRNNCVYNTLKGFDDSWVVGKKRISAAEPEGYTRIGPALRHSKTLIERQSARQKWIILLSDGKPNDYDTYEGKYGIADVKQALREIHESHISSYAIAIESVARYYLPQMFGQNHYSILSHSDMLISSLTQLYRRINNH